MTREACRRVAGIMDGIPLPVLIVDAQARMIGANPAAEALFGPNLLDRPFVTVIRHPAVLQALDRVLSPDRHPAPPPDPVLPTPPEGGAVLRAQIAADRTRVVAPIIDDIDYKTFMYKMVVLEQLGHFDWHLTFEWKPLSAANRARQGGEHKPFDTPIHAGGLYAIARSWFDELGAKEKVVIQRWLGEDCRLMRRFPVEMEGRDLDLEVWKRD